MIYCPHCRKPTARSEGPCPHCGNELSKKGGVPAGSGTSGAAPGRTSAASPSMPSAKPKVTPAQAAPSPSAGVIPLQSSDSGAGTDFGSGGDDGGLGIPGLAEDGGAARETMSGLALESLDPGPAVPETSASENVMDEYSIREVAGYGRPDDGVVGAIKYWLKVRARQQELRKEILDAEEENEKQALNKLHLQAELGKKGHEVGVKAGAVGARISKALAAAGELKSVEKQRLSLSTKHRAKTESLGAAIELLEKKIAPARAQEKELLDEKQALRVKQKGVETQLKRIQIDLRNMDDLIKQRQEAFSDLNKPKEERAALLKDIEQFDNRRPGLLKQAEQLDIEVHTFDAPIADIDYRIQQLRDGMAPELGKIMALTNQIDELTEQFAEQNEETAQKLNESQQALLEAWAGAGDQIMKTRVDEPGLVPLKKKVKRAVKSADESQSRLEVLNRAIDSYDAEVVKKAQIISAAAAGGLLLLIIVLLVVL